MIILIALIVLAAALVVAAAGVLGNGGPAHAVTHFSVLGYHVTGSAGTVFLYGIIVGAAGLLGLGLLLAGARRTSRRGSAARRRLRQSRRETAAASRERDDLIDQRDSALAGAAAKPGNGPASKASEAPQAGPDDDRWSRFRALGHRSAPAQAATPEVPASVSASGE
jgi:hypothetical protein